MSLTRQEIRDRYNERQRAKTAALTWPCVQCGGALKWHGGKGGSKRTLCLECAPDDRFRALVRRYGVDKTMFDAMYFDQDGKCAIPVCNREARSVDHCHETGRVRGLLCQGCNVALGFHEDKLWVAAALEYLS